MHATNSSKYSTSCDAKNTCAGSCLHSLISSLTSSLAAIPSDIAASQNYKLLRVMATIALFSVANMPVAMLVALCLRLQSQGAFQGMQADFMVFFIVTCELLMLYTSWKVTGFFTKRLARAQKQYQAATKNLEETQKLAAIGRLASSVNHEINNPLSIINEKSGLAADILEFSDDFPERDRFTKLVTSIVNAVERCQDISQRMLHFSRRKEAVIESINLNDLLTETASFLDRETRTRGVKVACSCHADLPCIMSERGPLQQVFLNLMNNGLAALPQPTSHLEQDAEENPYVAEIGFTTNFADNMVIVAIHDNGSGMTDDVQRHLFEPFFSTKGDKGTGLGMYISQNIIKRLGGTITMNSVLGQGTTFTICLPITQQ